MSAVGQRLGASTDAPRLSVSHLSRSHRKQKSPWAANLDLDTVPRQLLPLSFATLFAIHLDGMDPKKLTAVPAVGDDACSRRGTPTGLRGLTASPRLSLMRSRRDSYETMTSGVSSCSTESRVASSCV